MSATKAAFQQGGKIVYPLPHTPHTPRGGGRGGTNGSRPGRRAAAVVENVFMEHFCRIHATKENVSPLIHPQDPMFKFIIEHPDFPNMERAVRYYFRDGRRSATKFSLLLNEFLLNSRSVEILEFACGYGRVSRHWKNVVPNVKVTCCDVHDEAIEFLREGLNLPAVSSNHEPEGLDLPGEYNVVFALSFFSHMPRRVWGRWLEMLFRQVKKTGCLVFTTYGPASVRRLKLTVKMPDDGFWFHPVTEQLNPGITGYGSTVVTPKFVFGEVGQRLEARKVVYRPAQWWGHQDLYVVGK